MSESLPNNLTLMIPVGTQVVSRVEIKGADGKPVHPEGVVGVIISSPIDHEHAYRVRFPDGAEAYLRRHEIVTLRDYQLTGLQKTYSALAEYNLQDYIIYRCVIGSRAYGLDHDASDTDRRGIYLPPAELHWSLYGLPEQLENPANQDTYWELQKFLIMALKANPNVLEVLYSPLVELATPLAQELLDMRSIFLSKLVYQTYNGYVLSQFKKLGQDLRTRGEVKWKHVMHLLRLLISGITILKEGHVPVRVDQYREDLLAVRRGERDLEDLDKWRLDLHKQFDEAATTTTLPDRPDYARANAFLIKARRYMATLTSTSPHPANP
jgi:predicted nucleotidyltransferase